MTATRSRIAEEPYRCPFCGEDVACDEVIAVVLTGSTEASGCVDCAWAALNKVLSTRRSAA